MRSRDYSLDRGRVDIEETCESRFAGQRDEKLARILDGDEPALVPVAAQKRCAEHAGDVRATLGPVGAAPEERPARAFERRQIAAEVAQHRVAGSQKPLGERHAEPSGEMIVAAPSEAQFACGCRYRA